jgi:hypothetical protein
MRYKTKYDYINDQGFPPLLARLTDDPVETRSAELYLAVPKKWIPIADRGLIGHPGSGVISWTVGK